ncbi:MAG: hypothetical protein WCF59_10420 [Desulfobaccales bacterium]
MQLGFFFDNLDGIKKWRLIKGMTGKSAHRDYSGLQNKQFPFDPEEKRLGGVYLMADDADLESDWKSDFGKGPWRTWAGSHILNDIA